MARHIFALIAVLSVATGTAAAQDARAVLQAAAKNMGADTLRTIEITGTGMNAAVGQSFAPGTDWPRFEVTSYTRTIDYENRTSSEQLTRRQGNYPPQGGGGTPLQGEQQQHFVVSGNAAWNVQGATANPAAAAAEVRQLEIWLTPHGFLKAALAPGTNPTAHTRTSQIPGQPGGRVTVVSFTALGKYKVSGAINDQNLVEFVQTWIANPVLGDMLYEIRYTQYRDFGGVKFPGDIHTHQGDQRLDEGHNSFQLTVKNVRVNPSVPAITVPDNVRQASAPAPTKGGVAEAGRGRVVRRRCRGQQRGRRVQGFRSGRRVADQRGAIDRRHRRGAPARPEQADSLPREHPSPLRSSRRDPHLCGRGRDHRDACA